MIVCSFGDMRFMMNAVARGTINNGKTRWPTIMVDCINELLSSKSPIYVSNIGDNKATVTLLNRENVARRATEPPSMPVMTGAAVAVGQNMHIKVPCATISLSGLIAKYIVIAPTNCIESNIAVNFDGFNSLHDTLQYVIVSMINIRNGDRNATLPMCSCSNMPPIIAIGSVQGLMYRLRFDVCIIYAKLA